jgi:hypothetical protein
MQNANRVPAEIKIFKKIERKKQQTGCCYSGVRQRYRVVVGPVQQYLLRCIDAISKGVVDLGSHTPYTPLRDVQTLNIICPKDSGILAVTTKKKRTLCWDVLCTLYCVLFSTVDIAFCISLSIRLAL